MLFLIFHSHISCPFANWHPNGFYIWRVDFIFHFRRINQIIWLPHKHTTQQKMKKKRAAAAKISVWFSWNALCRRCTNKQRINQTCQQPTDAQFQSQNSIKKNLFFHSRSIILFFASHTRYTHMIKQKSINAQLGREKMHRWLSREKKWWT